MDLQEGEETVLASEEMPEATGRKYNMAWDLELCIFGKHPPGFKG